MMVFTSIIAILIMSSCKKNELAPPNQTSSQNIAGTSQLTLNVTARNWAKDASGLYVNTFENIIPPSYNGSVVKVYLLNYYDHEIPINQSINFMGGELWATTPQANVKIIYRGQTLPFTYLNIKIVVG
jgi:hypothetical protein